MDALTEGRQAKTVEPDDEDEAAFIASLNLLTSKPVIYAANVSESDLADDGCLLYTSIGISPHLI